MRVEGDDPLGVAASMTSVNDQHGAPVNEDRRQR
jgi:hypothetical protein